MLGPFCSENVRNNVVFHSSETTLRNHFRLVLMVLTVLTVLMVLQHFVL